MCEDTDAGADDSGIDASVEACTPKIVFVSARGGNGEIYTMNPDGTDITNLTNDVVPDSAPVWSPDGLRIAYAKGEPLMRDIFVMDWDGSNPRNITQTPGIDERNPSWSPAGDRLVFATFDGDSTRELETVNADGTDSVTITNGDVSPQEPHFSRTGNEVIFTNDFSGIFRVSALGGTYSVINQTGWHGKWSPTEDLITYTGFVPETDIYVRPLGGGVGGTTKLTETTDEIESFWFPDGSKILFVSLRDFNDQIYVMDKDGSNEVRISGGVIGESSSSPSMSPDGAEVVFRATRDPTGGIFKVNVDGTGEAVLSLEDTATEPAWSPCQP